ncbi:hypothetical protein BO71DRAFT_189214 [Aspergillus ellipticus CBS 707.79]|uniref:Uncharacterized protein n=1 Tax=Aspergillus ellipticus CBS 707.79 TaxID=1448320 RepID=A0A319EWL2_9EURO|nr:hypothetical protein BO71DRAFT_189214 [Aspergillus ellipticus CBS 707.79]
MLSYVPCIEHEFAHLICIFRIQRVYGFLSFFSSPILLPLPFYLMSPPNIRSGNCRHCDINHQQITYAYIHTITNKYMRYINILFS